MALQEREGILGRWPEYENLTKLFLEDAIKRKLTEFLGRQNILIYCLKRLIVRLPKRPIANLDALRAANAIPANFAFLEITDSCERLFQRFGIRSNGSGYPFEKNCHPSNDSGYPSEKNCHPFERLGLSVGKNCHPPFERLRLSVGKSCHPFGRLGTVTNHFQRSRSRRTCQNKCKLQ